MCYNSFSEDVKVWSQYFSVAILSSVLMNCTGKRKKRSTLHKSHMHVEVFKLEYHDYGKAKKQKQPFPLYPEIESEKYILKLQKWENVRRFSAILLSTMLLCNWKGAALWLQLYICINSVPISIPPDSCSKHLQPCCTWLPHLVRMSSSVPVASRLDNLTIPKLSKWSQSCPKVLNLHLSSSSKWTGKPDCYSPHAHFVTWDCPPPGETGNKEIHKIIVYFLSDPDLIIWLPCLSVTHFGAFRDLNHVILTFDNNN